MAGSPQAIGVIDPFDESSAAVLGPNIAYLAALSLPLMSTGGTGSQADPWTGWEAALNAAPANSWVYAPAVRGVGIGFYLQTTRIEVRLGMTIFGDGLENTVIYGTMSGTAWRVDEVPANPFAALQHGHITIRDLQIKNTNAANTGSGLLIVSSAYINLTVKICGFRFGVSLIFAERVTMERCNFEFQDRIGVWIVNSPDYNTTYADLNYNYPLGSAGTNIIVMRDCQFNMSTGNDSSGFARTAIVDDGGNTHNVDSCNFNGCQQAFRIIGATNLRISGQFEAAGSHSVNLGDGGTYHGAGGVGPNGIIKLEDCICTPTSTNSFVYGGSTEKLILSACKVSGSNAVVANAVAVNTIINEGSAGGGALCAGSPTRLINISGTTIEARGATITLQDAVRAGSFTLVAGTYTLVNATVTANTKVLQSRRVLGGAVGTLSYVVTPGTNIVFTSASGTDASTFDYMLVEAT